MWAVVDLRWFWTVSKAHRFLVMNFLASNHEWVLRNLIGTSVMSQATRAIPKHRPFLWLWRDQSVGTLFRRYWSNWQKDRLSLEDFDDLTDGKSSSNISIAPGGLWGMPEHRVQRLKSTAVENCLEATYMGVSKNRGTSRWMVYNGKPY